CSPFIIAASGTTAPSTASSCRPGCGRILLTAPHATGTAAACWQHSISEPPELREQIFIAALGSTIFLGAALFWVLRAERRRAILGPRLRAIAAPRSSTHQAVVSVRRPRPRRKALPAVLL